MSDVSNIHCANNGIYLDIVLRKEYEGHEMSLLPVSDVTSRRLKSKVDNGVIFMM